jgi:hypothetical protein
VGSYVVGDIKGVEESAVIDCYSVVFSGSNADSVPTTLLYLSFLVRWTFSPN